MTPDPQPDFARPHELVFVAGPNGAGKTTIAQRYIQSRFPHWPQVNADLLLESIQGVGDLTKVPASSESAANIVDQTVLCLSLLGEPVIVETVLSSLKYCSIVPIARRQGLIFRLVYVATENPSINVARVSQRVQAGGHDVPEDRIRKRWLRSIENLPWFAARADRLVVADNSGAELRIVALRHHGGPLEILDPAHPACGPLSVHAGSRATS